jgi:signal peptidase II
MLYLFCGVLAVALVALDQWVKWWIVGHLAVGETAPLLPHVLGLTHVHNTGGAWSLLNQHTWLLSAVSAAVILLLLFVLVTRRVRQPAGVLTLTLVLAGAAGNLIDRVRLGYVVDMFQTLFMNFPIFNVADICVVCGGIAFCLWFVLRGEK